MFSILPDVRLDEGVFTVQSGVPLFIDNNDTYHFDIGKKMANTLLAYYNQNHKPDTVKIDLLSRRIAHLQDEVIKANDTAEHAFQKGREFQFTADTEFRKNIYHKGRMDQKTEDYSVIFALYRQLEEQNKEIEELRHQNKLLRRKAKHVSKLAKDSTRLLRPIPVRPISVLDLESIANESCPLPETSQEPIEGHAATNTTEL